jgi:hypothetical protein
MLADNSSHLSAAARSKHEATRQRALAALARLEADGTQVTVTALAKTAGVARSWIYTQPDLIDRIAATPARPTKPLLTRTTDESWQRRLERPTEGSKTSPRRTSNCAPNWPSPTASAAQNKLPR